MQIEKRLRIWYTVFEQDYIIRLIKEMIRAILKLFFHIDTDNPIKDL